MCDVSLQKKVEGGITAARGFKASGVRCGVKSQGLDLALIYSERDCAAAGVFTTNAFQAAPVIVCRQRLASGRARAIVANSGNANAVTGEQGIRDAEEICSTVADLLGVDRQLVLICSTGIIGVRLPVDRIKRGIVEAVQTLSPDLGDAAAEAIMTTDTKPKVSAYEFEVYGKTVRIGGIAKGAGMIKPDLATMLCFITTDAEIEADLLSRCLRRNVGATFNCLTVDGDTSTNDSVIVLANGASGCQVKEGSKAYELFDVAVGQVCLDLARAIAQDGEGATKFVEVVVKGAVDGHDAKNVAMAVANSLLVKTALFGKDPNWGRVLCAVGRSGAEVVPARTSLWFGDVLIVKDGESVGLDSAIMRSVMNEPSLRITIDLGIGNGSVTVYTCDLSYDYVRINAEYHT